jgi:hypothetical protein
MPVARMKGCYAVSRLPESEIAVNRNGSPARIAAEVEKSGRQSIRFYFCATFPELSGILLVRVRPAECAMQRLYQWAFATIQSKAKNRRETNSPLIMSPLLYH